MNIRRQQEGTKAVLHSLLELGIWNFKGSAEVPVHLTQIPTFVVVI